MIVVSLAKVDLTGIYQSVSSCPERRDRREQGLGCLRHPRDHWHTTRVLPSAPDLYYYKGVRFYFRWNGASAGHIAIQDLIPAEQQAHGGGHSRGCPPQSHRLAHTCSLVSRLQPGMTPRASRSAVPDEVLRRPAQPLVAPHHNRQTSARHRQPGQNLDQAALLQRAGHRVA